MQEVSHEMGNLVSNGTFASSGDGDLPKGWEAVIPNPHQAPEFQPMKGADGGSALGASGNGRETCFGYVRQRVRLEPCKTYRLRVRFRCSGLGDVNLHLLHGVFAETVAFNDGIFDYVRSGKEVIGENRFPGPSVACDADVRLYFRYSPFGKVWWEEVSLTECEPIPCRPVKIACSWGRNSMGFWEKWLDSVGEIGTDIALLPEFFNSYDKGPGSSSDIPKNREPTDGPAAHLMASKAREHGMYVVGSYICQRGELIFNSAPLYGRRGELVGTYDKNQLYLPEANDGITPGVEFPVFDTDVGRVGILTCYDSWFPETFRLLAYRGAEVILFPNGGYDLELMPARAADNGVVVAASTLDAQPGIWETSGAQAGEQHANPNDEWTNLNRQAHSAVLSYERDYRNRWIAATIDLSRKYSPGWHGGPMLAAPGGRRCRQTLIRPIEEEIAIEARRWWHLGINESGRLGCENTQ